MNNALRLFAAQGYNAVGVAQICKTTDIAKPSLYHHFGSKLGLLQAIADERYRPFLEDVRVKAAYRRDLTAVLEDTLRLFLEHAGRDSDFARLRLTVAFSPPESEEHRVFRPLTEKLHETIRLLFIEAAKDHGNMIGRHLRYAASFLGTADAYVGLKLAGVLDSDEPLIREIVRHFMHGLFS